MDIFWNHTFHSVLKVYFWLWEHLCYQMYFSRLIAKILGTQQNMLGAQLKMLGVPVPSEKQNLRHYYVIFFVLYFSAVFVVLMYFSFETAIKFLLFLNQFQQQIIITCYHCVKIRSK